MSLSLTKATSTSSERDVEMSELAWTQAAGFAAHSTTRPGSGSSLVLFLQSCNYRKSQGQPQHHCLHAADMSLEDASSTLPSGEGWDGHSVSGQVLPAHLSALSANGVRSSCSSFKCNGSHAMQSIFASWVFWRNGMTACRPGRDGAGNASRWTSLTAASHHEFIQGATLCWRCREGIGVALKPPALCCKLQAAFLCYT